MAFAAGGLELPAPAAMIRTGDRSMRQRLHLAVYALLAAATAAATVLAAGAPPAAAPQPVSPRLPQYDKNRALLLPADYRQWLLAGTSLGLSYAEGPVSDERPMFKETLIEPTAYRHFVETGEFREGTMLAMMMHGVGENVLPGRQGQFASDVHDVEMAVKDSARVPEGWAYYGFGGMNGQTQASAQPAPKTACYDCHREHPKRDNAFLQVLHAAGRGGFALIQERGPEPSAVDLLTALVDL
jgi:cytochrome P460